MNHSMHGKDGLKDRRKRGNGMGKRHEIAEAIHRDNPAMPMEKKMKIATAAAMGKR